MKLTGNIDKLGTAGLFLTALFSPCCFPLFAFAASALGFGSFELFGGWTMWVFQLMAVISVGGLIVSFRKHKNLFPSIVATISALLIIYSYNFYDGGNWIYLMYGGMFGLLAATVHNYLVNKKFMSSNFIELNSVLTCPECGHKKMEIMPTDACTYFYECENCKMRLKPLEGDCCVYCSYGTVKCPPIQNGENCC
jgi:hypothetical protein